MTRTSIVSFIAITAGIGGALAAGVGLEDRAYGDEIATLTAQEVETHAAAEFFRADVNGDGVMNADEYTALATVTAELSLLNGFVAFETGKSEETVALPFERPGALTRGERARIEATARNEFYTAAGSDGVLSAPEYKAFKVSRFSDADRNRNGKLAKAELRAFAAAEAKVGVSGV